MLLVFFQKITNNNCSKIKNQLEIPKNKLKELVPLGVATVNKI
jgi:hypothetical protein